MARRSAVVLFLAGSLVAGVSPALGQTSTPAGKAPHWGAGVSFTPSWKAEPTFQRWFLVEGEGQIEGSEFTIGVVRGSTLGGDWGVSFVRKSIKDGATIVDAFEESSPNSFNQSTFTAVFQKVFYQGVEAHLFFPFVNIKNRVQIGINVAGGIASVKGTIEETQDSISIFIPPVGPPITHTSHSVETRPAREVVMEMQPLAKVEAQASVILHPSLKIKISGGLNMPSVPSFRIGAVYLIGAK